MIINVFIPVCVFFLMMTLMLIHVCMRVSPESINQEEIMGRSCMENIGIGLGQDS